MKDLSIGGIVMLNRTDKGDKDEEIVEPMEVVISYMFYVLPWFSQIIFNLCR